MYVCMHVFLFVRVNKEFGGVSLLVGRRNLCMMYGIFNKINNHIS